MMMTIKKKLNNKNQNIRIKPNRKKINIKRSDVVNAAVQYMQKNKHIFKCMQNSLPDGIII